MEGKKLLTINLDDKLKTLDEGNELKYYKKIISLLENEKQYDRIYGYWTDGQKVYYACYLVKGADIESFVQYEGGWGKDKNHCYSVGIRLKGADAKSFKILNLTYAKDNSNVWTLGGIIKDADVASFEICDSGKDSLGKMSDGKSGLRENFVAQGYGKDKKNVYYYNFDGKPHIVKTACPETFISLGDCLFGYDEKCVFSNGLKLQKSDPTTWKKFKDLYHYSKDKKNIYYFNRIIKEADAETFEIIKKQEEMGLPLQLAKDKNNYYWMIE